MSTYPATLMAMMASLQGGPEGFRKLTYLHTLPLKKLLPSLHHLMILCKGSM